jgi:hypothetical protein
MASLLKRSASWTAGKLLGGVKASSKAKTNAAMVEQYRQNLAASEGMHHESRLETSAARTMNDFFEPFALESRADAVHQITGAGYQTIKSLAGLSDEDLQHLGLCEGDAMKVMLASWLHELGLDSYGERLVEAGCDSLLRLVELSDEQLRRTGVAAIGPRRQILRRVREDLALQAMVDRAKEKKEKASGVGGHERGLYARRRPEHGGGASAAAAAQTGAAAAAAAAAAPAAQAAALQLGAPQPSAPLPSGHVADAYMRRDTWDERWKITSNASLGSTNGHTEAHHAARTPREFRVVMSDGSEMLVT